MLSWTCLCAGTLNSNGKEVGTIVFFCFEEWTCENPSSPDQKLFFAVWFPLMVVYCFVPSCLWSVFWCCPIIRLSQLTITSLFNYSTPLCKTCTSLSDQGSEAAAVQTAAPPCHADLYMAPQFGGWWKRRDSRRAEINSNMILQFERLWGKNKERQLNLLICK